MMFSRKIRIPSLPLNLQSFLPSPLAISPVEGQNGFPPSAKNRWLLQRLRFSSASFFPTASRASNTQDNAPASSSLSAAGVAPTNRLLLAVLEAWLPSRTPEFHLMS